MAPFTEDKLRLLGGRVEGAYEFLSQTRQEDRLISAVEVTDEYSFWNGGDQGFAKTDMMYAVERYLDTLIYYSKLPYRTEYSPNLKVVKL
jgi:hypothetical protein